MVISILHRLTGVVLSVGSILLVSWLLALASGPERFGALNTFLGGTIGSLLLVGWSFALFLHMGNGVRHLFWDVGMGFELSAARRSGWMVVVFALIATALTWAIGLGFFGGGA